MMCEVPTFVARLPFAQEFDRLHEGFAGWYGWALYLAGVVCVLTGLGTIAVASVEMTPLLDDDDDTEEAKALPLPLLVELATGSGTKKDEIDEWRCDTSAAPTPSYVSPRTARLCVAERRIDFVSAENTREQGVTSAELADRLSKRLPSRKSERRLSASFEQRILRNSAAGLSHAHAHTLDMTHAPTTTCRKSHYHMPLGHTGPFLPHPGATPAASRFNSQRRQSFTRSGVASTDNSTHGGSMHTRACGQQCNLDAASRWFRWGVEPRGPARPTTESSTSSQPAAHGSVSAPPPGAYRPSADIPQPVPFPAPTTSLQNTAAAPQAPGLYEPTDAPTIKVVPQTPPTFGEMEA